MAREEEAMTRKETLAELRLRGYDLAVVEYSGGNDSGSIDRIGLMHAKPDAPEEMQDLDTLWLEDISTFYEGEDELDAYGSDGRDRALAEGLCEPIYSEHGSFAIDGSVEGFVLWEARQGVMSLTGSFTSSSGYSDYYSEAEDDA